VQCWTAHLPFAILATTHIKHCCHILHHHTHSLPAWVVPLDALHFVATFSPPLLVTYYRFKIPHYCGNDDHLHIYTICTVWISYCTLSPLLCLTSVYLPTRLLLLNSTTTTPHTHTHHTPPHFTLYLPHTTPYTRFTHTRLAAVTVIYHGTLCHTHMLCCLSIGSRLDKFMGHTDPHLPATAHTTPHYNATQPLYYIPPPRPVCDPTPPPPHLRCYSHITLVLLLTPLFWLLTLPTRLHLPVTYYTLLPHPHHPSYTVS